MNAYLAALFRIALGAIFIAAALPKIAAPHDFAWSIAHYHIVPDGLINLAALILPAVELLFGAALVFGVARAASLLAVLVMLLIFIAAIASAMVRDLDISCGCFSTAPDAARMTSWTLIADIAMLLGCIHAMIWDRGHLSLASLLRRG